MIIDTLEHIREYEALLPGLGRGMQAISACDLSKEGRYEFDGGYFMVQIGMTKPFEEGLFEAHRKNTDVQIVWEGSEELAWEEKSRLVTVKPYRAEQDAEFLKGDPIHHMRITEKMFYAVFPHDAHQPVSCIATPDHYKKIVMKLPCPEKLPD